MNPSMYLFQRWELIEPLIRQQDLCLAISAFTAGSKVKMEPCNAKEPRQVRTNTVSLSNFSLIIHLKTCI